MNDSETRQRSARYPRHTLEKAEVFGKIIFEEGARNCNTESIAMAAGYKSAENGAFASLRGSASHFGLIKSSSGYISLDESWIEAFNSEEERTLKKIRRAAMLQPQLYQRLFEDFSGKQLNHAKLSRDLHLNQKYGVLKDASAVAAEVFIESAKYAELMDSRGFLHLPNEIEAQEVAALPDQQSELVIETPNYVNTTPIITSSSFKSTPINTFSVDIEGLDRIEIKLRGGSKAYLFIPVPLPKGEKVRLKGLIDLLLEEEVDDENS